MKSMAQVQPSGSQLVPSERFQADPIRDSYRGASVLLDGVTGFVGKAIFEKLLRVYGDELSKVYLLIRKGNSPKKLSDPLERLRKEVLTNKVANGVKDFFRDGSGCERSISNVRRSNVLSPQIFATLRGRFSSADDFDTFIREKVVPVEGDLTAPGLGLSTADRSELVESCNIIIHCAASVNFDERIDWSFRMNTLGSLRMMDLAEECRNLGESIDGLRFATPHAGRRPRGVAL